MTRNIQGLNFSTFQHAHKFPLHLQEKYYDGWPDNPEDLPVQHMTQEHREFLLEKCSRYKNVRMPDFLETSPAKGTTAVIVNHSNTLVTPPPNAGAIAKKQNKCGIEVDHKSSKITPGPTTQKKGGPPKFSKQQQELHAQWQAAAVEMAGPDARVVVDAEIAKQMILKFMYDAFRPMSATQIYQVQRWLIIFVPPYLGDFFLIQLLNLTHFAGSQSDSQAHPEGLPRRHGILQRVVCTIYGQ